MDDRRPDAGAGGLHGPLPLPLDPLLGELLHHGEDVHLPALHGADPAFARTHQVGAGEVSGFYSLLSRDLFLNSFSHLTKSLFPKFNPLHFVNYVTS